MYYICSIITMQIFIMVCLNKYVGLGLSISFLALFHVSVVVAGDHAPVGARSAAMGYASVAVPDGYSLWNNPSGLSFAGTPMAVWSVHVPFGISKLSSKSLGLIVPVDQTILASGLTYFGYSSYHEWEGSLVLARKLAPGWSLGVRMGVCKKFIAQGDIIPLLLVGSSGVMGNITDRLRLGLYAYNITRASKNTSYEQRIPSILCFGLSHQVSSEFLIITEVSKDLEMLPQWKFGAEYSVADKVFLRGGFSLGSVRQFSFGFGYQWNNFFFDVAFAYHQLLGATPDISMVWQNPVNP